MEPEWPTHGFKTYGFTVIVIILSYFTSLAFYNLYLHPLSRFPGPLIRSAFALPSILEIWIGNAVHNTHALHVKYGRVVRIAPDALSFNTAQAWKGWDIALILKVVAVQQADCLKSDIYGFRQGEGQIPKDYKRAPPIKDALPILCIVPSDGKMKEPYLSSHYSSFGRCRSCADAEADVARAFSDGALRQQAHLVASHMKRFIEKVQVRSHHSQDGRVDLNEWFDCLAFDIVTDLSFGEPLGALERGTRDAYIDDFFRACRMFVVIPLMHEYWLFRKVFQGLMSVPAVRKVHEMGYLATRAKVERRMVSATKKKDFMKYVRGHSLYRVPSS
jgi:hypothetical protein